MRCLRFLALFTLAFLLLGLRAEAQTNPCTAPLPAFAIVSDPSHAVVAQLPGYATTLGGVPLWTDVELKVVPRGAGADATALNAIANPKAQWQLVTGTTDCYQVGTVGQFLFGVPANTEFELYARLRGAVSGPWRTNGVPFGRAVLGAPTGLRITRLACEALSRLSGSNWCNWSASSRPVAGKSSL
jgi:hypothetical protein